MLSLAVFAALAAVGAAYDPSEDMGPAGYEAAYESQPDYSGMGSDYMASRSHGDDDRRDGRYDDYHDWLPTGTGYTFHKFPKYNYKWYYPTYTYTYPVYSYTYPTYYYYTTPVYSSWYYEPVTYDPWWAANVYGMSSKTYYGSWSWSSAHGMRLS